MSIIWTIIIGFIVGVVAKFLKPGRDPGGRFRGRCDTRLEPVPPEEVE